MAYELEHASYTQPHMVKNHDVTLDQHVVIHDPGMLHSS